VGVVTSLRRAAVSRTVPRLRALPPALLLWPMRLWTRSRTLSRADLAVFLSTYEGLEALPTVRRGLDALGMRSMLEWTFAARDIASMPSPYTHPKQLPGIFHPGLRAVAFPEPPAWVRTIEAAIPEIREELRAALGRRRGFQPYPPIGIEKPSAAWNVLYLYAGGVVDDCARLFPRTFAAVESVPRFRRVGISCFSALNPGAEITPHCGPMNGAIRVHLCLDGADRSWIRVGTEERSLADGRGLLFDDSFEHEVRHHGPRTRFVLFFEIWHPDWRDDEIEPLEALHGALRRTRWSRDVDERRRRERGLLDGEAWWVG
jgi:aspartyl/asparaginyl beta-hydroxylase